MKCDRFDKLISISGYVFGLGLVLIAFLYHFSAIWYLDFESVFFRVSSLVIQVAIVSIIFMTLHAWNGRHLDKIYNFDAYMSTNEIDEVDVIRSMLRALHVRNDIILLLVVTVLFLVLFFGNAYVHGGLR